MTPERLDQISKLPSQAPGAGGLQYRWIRQAWAALNELLAYVNELRTGRDMAMDERDQACARVAELEAELEPEPKVDDTVQLVIPRGPMLDGLQRVLRALGCVMAGPLPLEREPIPTYVLQPLSIEEPTL